LKKYILPFVLFVFSIALASGIWDYIKIPYNLEKQIIGEDYLLNLHNPINDTIRFIIFLGIPFLTLIIFFQISEKNILSHFKQIIFQNNKNLDIKDITLNKFFFFFLVLIIVEFFILDFTNFDYKIDIFHEGLWLSASQNSKLEENFWISTYIGRGFFGNFHPYFIWKLFGLETIGIVRFSHLVLIFFNKILLLMVARKIALMVDLKNEIKIIFFILLSVSFLYFTSYGEPIFFIRSFLLLLFLLILLNFLSKYNSNKITIISIGLFSSISLFWYIDIGIYINFTIVALSIFFLVRREFKNFLFLNFSVLFGWSLIYLLFPHSELIAFFNNSLLIISTIEYIGGLIYPTPFLQDFRSTKALFLFLVTGFLIIISIKDLNKKNLTFLISILFMFFVSLLFFRYGLNRSDSPHIRIAQSFAYLPFFSLIFYLTLKKFEKKIKFNKFIKFTSLSLFILFIVIEKKHESKNFINITNSISSIQKLVNFEDKVFLNEDYNSFISYYKNLTLKDSCITTFTNEVAISYFLKKPTCSKFYTMYVATPNRIQNELIKDINSKKPNFLIYNSSLDLYSGNIQRLKLVNKFITSNYRFYEKFKHWEIYKINDF